MIIITFTTLPQNMEAVTRQTGQHIEFEPEWEGAFNFQLKLADIITLMVDWCSSDVSCNHFIIQTIAELVLES